MSQPIGNIHHIRLSMRRKMWGFLTFLVAGIVRYDPISVAYKHRVLTASESRQQLHTVHTSQTSAHTVMTGYYWHQNCFVMLGFIYEQTDIHQIKCCCPFSDTTKEGERNGGVHPTVICNSCQKACMDPKQTCHRVPEFLDYSAIRPPGPSTRTNKDTLSLIHI